jgi:hypothetical protein
LVVGGDVCVWVLLGLVLLFWVLVVLALVVVVVVVSEVEEEVLVVVQAVVLVEELEVVEEEEEEEEEKCVPCEAGRIVKQGFVQLHHKPCPVQVTIEGERDAIADEHRYTSTGHGIEEPCRVQSSQL